MGNVDATIAFFVDKCPQSVRGRTGELTPEEREAVSKLNAQALIDQLIPVSGGVAPSINWLDPQTGRILYEDDRRKTTSLKELGYAMTEIGGGKKVWILNRPEVRQAVRNAKLYGYDQ